MRGERLAMKRRHVRHERDCSRRVRRPDLIFSVFDRAEEIMSGTKIAVIGTGNVGGGLGTTFAKAGFPVKFGVRPNADTKAVLEAAGSNASATEVGEAAAWADVVFMAVPGSAAVDVARSLADKLGGKIVIDCNNPLVWKEGPVWTPPPEGSLAAAIQKAAPNSRVVKAFNQFGAEYHKDPRGAQVFLASDDAEAKKTVSDIAKKAGFDPIDSGPLRNAAVLENLAMLWIHLAMVGGHGRDFAFHMKKG
jgi:8-hydroxy-5-deazaflavin:NADPH oxidoreductase